ncbi:putative phytosulfokines 6 [Iris pallida]|uniref:Phytosulfokine n=1 Tax=Iris pallida TaxID=29817 RepID=A0AAX6ESK8_IRIPA|nr:putative phytosulfokines 6 [Iris pallida]KAJ6851760.1 putative phytosulfokines 6 [Iris pallida]
MMNHEPTDLQLDHSGDDQIIEASNVMGVEEHCSDGDEECLKRRVMMISEPHLDYIYTQHQKP